MTNLRTSITMSSDELAAFLDSERTAIFCSFRRTGDIHAVPLWYAVSDAGSLLFSTKAKSQKVANLRADARVTVLVEAGATYHELRGVELRGHVELVEDRAELTDIVERMAVKYHGAAQSNRGLEERLHNRVGLRLVVDHVASWDHRKIRA